MKSLILIRSCILLTQTLQGVAAVPSPGIATLDNALYVPDLISGLGPALGRRDVSSYTAKKAPGMVSIFSDSISLGTGKAQSGGRLSKGEVVTSALQKRGYDDPDPRPLAWPLPRPQPGPSNHFKCPKNWRDIAYNRNIFTPPRRDRSLFYAGVGAQFFVEEIAKSGTYSVLIFLLQKPYVLWAMRNCDQQEFWRLASAAMAHTSSGVVTVMMPKASMKYVRCYFENKPDGRPTVWKEVEYPALKVNNKVSKVLRYDVQEAFNGRELSEGKGLVLLDRKEMKYAC